MAAEVQEFRLQVTGQQQSSQRLNRFGGSLQSLEQRADAARGRVSGAAGAIGNVGTIVGQTNPVVGAFAGVIGTAGSAIEALSSALGGPLGLIAGGAVAALGVFVTQTALAEEEQEKLNEAVAEGTRTLGDYVNAVKARNDAELQTQRIQAGVADREVLQGRAEQLQAQLDQLNEAAQAIRFSGGPSSEDVREGLQTIQQERIRLEQEIADVQAKLDRNRREEDFDAQLEQIRKRDELERELQKKRREGEGGGRTAEDLMVEGRFLTVPEMAGAGRAGQPRGGPSEQALQSRRGLSGLGTDILQARETFGQTSDIQEQEQLLQAREEREQKAMQRRLDAAREAAAEEQQLAQQVAATWEDASATMATSLGSAVTALIQGNDEALGQILQNIGTQSIAQGTQAVLRAAVSAAFGNPAAGAQAAAGGALIAFGAGLGGAGGAAGGGASASGAARPTAPQQSQTFQSGSLSPGETTVNIYGIADRRTGEQVVEAMRQTKRERGSQAVKV